jgi:hypothetical protein
MWWDERKLTSIFSTVVLWISKNENDNDDKHNDEDTMRMITIED